MVALLLGGLGLACLYLMARQTGTPVIRISQITPMMNFASVRVAGIVKNNPYIKRKGEDVEYLAFTVSDGTGDLQVSVSREMARKLVEEKRVPGKGDEVELAGSLSVSGDGRIRLRASRLISAERGISNIEYSTPKAQ